MFRKNEGHLNPPEVSSINALPDKQRQRLEASWAGIIIAIDSQEQKF